MSVHSFELSDETPTSFDRPGIYFPKRPVDRQVAEPTPEQPTEEGCMESSERTPDDSPALSEGGDLTREDSLEAEGDRPLISKLTDDMRTSFDRPRASFIPNLPVEETPTEPEDEIRRRKTAEKPGRKPGWGLGSDERKLREKLRRRVTQIDRRLGPLPWDDVNAIDAVEVADRLGLTKAKRERGKYGCVSCASSDALHAYPRGRGHGGGFYCWSCNTSFSNVDAACAVWGLDAVGACRQLAESFGVLIPDAGPPNRLRGTRKGARRTGRTSRREIGRPGARL